MVAGLLFIIGLVSVLVSLGLAGLNAPALIQKYNAAAAAGTDVMPTVFALARDLSWMVTPVVGGLLLMAVARIIILLAAINRSLRGEP